MKRRGEQSPSNKSLWLVAYSVVLRLSYKLPAHSYKLNHVEHFLEKLFESVPRVRILRLFMQNLDQSFTFDEIARKCQLRPRIVRIELVKLVSLGIVKCKTGRIKYKAPALHIKSGSSRRKKQRYKKIESFHVNPDFDFIRELRELVVRSSTTSKKKLFTQIKQLGHVRLAVLSGIFLKNDAKSRTDLLIVGDYITQRKIENFLSKIESELGKPVSYTLMDTEEFKYRLKMYDRFLRDIFEFPHEKLINRMQNLVQNGRGI